MGVLEEANKIYFRENHPFLYNLQYILALIYFGLMIYTLINIIKRQNKRIYLYLIIAGFVIVPLGLITLIVYWITGKDSVRESEQDKELRKAQLSALKKGKAKVELKGKIKKLK